MPLTCRRLETFHVPHVNMSTFHVVFGQDSALSGRQYRSVQYTASWPVTPSRVASVGGGRDASRAGGWSPGVPSLVGQRSSSFARPPPDPVFPRHPTPLPRMRASGAPLCVLPRNPGSTGRLGTAGPPLFGPSKLQNWDAFDKLGPL